MTTNLWTVGQGLVTRRLVPRRPARRGRPAPEALVADAGAGRRRRRTARNGSRAEPQPQLRSRKPQQPKPRPRRPAAPREAEPGPRPAVSDERDGRGDRRDGRRGEVAGAARARAPRSLARQGRGPLPGAVGGRARPARRRLHAGAGARDAPPRERRPGEAPADRTRARPRAACATLLDARHRRDRRPLPDRDRGDGRRRSTATCYGDDLGLLIGRHGQTIDAVQVLASAIVGRRRARSGERSSSTRPATATAAAARSRRSRCAAPRRRVRTGARVELEPMSAAERKIVHTSLERPRRRDDRRARATSRTATSSSSRPTERRWRRSRPGSARSSRRRG